MSFVDNIIKQSRIIILLCLFCFNLSSQINLIPNPSFEDSTGIPQSHSEFTKCKNWYSTSITPDYFSIFSPVSVAWPGNSVNIPYNCLGYQSARTGDFYAGIFLRNYYDPLLGLPPIAVAREAIGIKLQSPLIANHSYSFTMYYSLANGSGYTTNGLDVIFSYTPNVINTTPTSFSDTTYYFNSDGQVTHDNSLITDTLNWIPLTGCFIAKGGEEYVLIGHYKDALHSAIIPIAHQNFPCNFLGNELNTACYIYIDDVSLYDMGLYLPASAKNDTLICNGTALNISNTPLKDSSVVVWSPPSALSCTNCPNPIATPTTSTLYYINKNICGASSKDSVMVTVNDCDDTEYFVPNVFTPNYDDVNDTWGVKFSNIKYIKNFQIHIYDRWGLLVYSTNPDINTPNSKWDGHTSAGSECSAGVYFYVISFDKNKERVELKGSVNLFR